MMQLVLQHFCLLTLSATAAVPRHSVADGIVRVPRDSLAIVEVVRGIIAADNASDLAKVMSFYSDSALLLPPGEEPVQGHRTIQPRYQRLFDEYRPAIEGMIAEVRLGGEWAFVRGRNRGVLHSKAGAGDRMLNDVYIMLLKREPDGRWRIWELMWHSSAPPT
ncbi:MAG TPA: DUF4440 domain-containing protein [Gemmatimonadaceae bacterium]|nr:DUF4440 domain-containing protein [Gemmatimonadaceae bacterium]